MKKYTEMTKDELMQEKTALEAEYEKIKNLGLSLDMSRGKPGADQLDLSLPMLDVLKSDSDMKSESGLDVRNYACLDGIPEAKALIAGMVGAKPEQAIVYGNSSLNIMYDQVARAFIFGICGNTPWCKLDKVKFLCPVPGYDRHFAITEEFGVEMINIPMTEDGPDMDMVEKYVNNDASVKGIWCVPKYSNPQGVVYSDETVERFAKLKPAADDFRIFWDNAYTVHHLYDDKQAEIPNILELCEKEGNPDMVFEFCYDRHFAITEEFGVEMINIPMTEDGPDMDMVEKYVNNDASVKGIWCVPKYSNPQGVVYSDETVERFAKLKPAADDFRIFWDNAYTVHHLYDDKQAEIPNILELCEKEGNPDMVFEFCSTSKVTFPGAGLAGICTSEKNREDIKKRLTIQTIGHDKINQLRHARFFKDVDGIKAHMAKHAALIRPKFELVENILTDEIASRGIGTWVKPLGGYFFGFEALSGCAKEIVAKCKEAGVTMTGAGSPFPYKKDPDDSVIRIAPTYPSLDELKKAAEVFVVVTRLVSVNKLLEA